MAPEKKAPGFLVRVDDFPWHGWTLDDYLEFHKLLLDHKIPYLLAVTPRLAKDHHDPACSEFRDLTADERTFLRDARPTVEVALHGLTHKANFKTNDYTMRSELVGTGASELASRIEQGLALLRDVGPVNVLVPPFNTFDLGGTAVFSRYFKVITGGPESIVHVGLRLSPSILSGMLYLPSYMGAYGEATEVLEFVREILQGNHQCRIMIPLSLHWHTEAKLGYAALRELCAAIEGHVLSWASILDGDAIPRLNDDSPK